MINNSVKKCCVCNNEKIGEFITIKDNKYHLCCIEDLQQRIDTYENPEDLTLMFMYCNEKAKDKIKELQKRIEEAIECIKDFEIQAKHINDEIYLDETLSNKLLEILANSDIRKRFRNEPEEAHEEGFFF